ncbi:MAG: VanW family protein [Clostridia bacterium]|nr:VanW family protein [Clostridia bacterium]
MARTQHIRLQMQEAMEAQLRPAFPEDAFSLRPVETPEEQMNDAAMIHRTEEDLAAYPDMVYQQTARRRRFARHSAPMEPPTEQPTADEPVQTPLVPADGELYAPRHGGAMWALIALVCATLIALLGYAVLRWHSAYAPFRQKVDIVSQDTIAQGVLIDQVHVGGMTRAQAVQALVNDASLSDMVLRMTIQVDGETWIITPQELPFLRNTGDVLDTAFAIGRQGSVETIASSTTPFEYRYQHLYHTVATHVDLHTEVTYDPATVRYLVGIIEANINRDAVDAQVATFDFAQRTFTFTEDRAGAKLDGEKLYQQIIDALNRKDLQAVIVASSEVITPGITKAELMNSFSLVSTYTTQTTSDANRNNNINLAANAVSGTVLMPGEVFSFNQTTGQRTAEKGYLPAAAISGGATVDEIGGGVCQVSSTLFNAAAMADLNILQRSPHTWPSNYVDKGRDATVNWPNLDFSFQNNKSTPIFLVAWYQQRQCTVEIYGAALSGGETIALETQLISTTEPPADAIFELNPSLAPGTVVEKKKARTGYVVDTYKVYMRNGREVRRDFLCTSNYQMIQQVLEYN